MHVMTALSVKQAAKITFTHSIKNPPEHDLLPLEKRNLQKQAAFWHAVFKLLVILLHIITNSYGEPWESPCEKL